MSRSIQQQIDAQRARLNKEASALLDTYRSNDLYVAGLRVEMVVSFYPADDENGVTSRVSVLHAAVPLGV